jgi:hypothetical protein
LATIGVKSGSDQKRRPNPARLFEIVKKHKGESEMTYDQKTSIDTDEPLTEAAPTIVEDENSIVLHHAAQINGEWRKAVSGIIGAGQKLLEAKKSLSGTGKWLRLFDPKIGNVAFKEDMAERLMKIAKNKVLTNSAHERNLPPSWSTLYVLSGATSKQLEKWLADGNGHREDGAQRRQRLGKAQEGKEGEKE